MNAPVVSVITPTWGRHDLLLERCIPSVQAQDYPHVQHVIISDGPDLELAEKITELVQPYREDRALRHQVFYSCMEDRPAGLAYGNRARREAIEKFAVGSYIGYVDDDDALKPGHCSALAAALSADESLMWAYSVMQSHSRDGSSCLIGYGPPACGQMGTPMIMHRRAALETATWGEPSATEDWDLVARWLDAGLPYASIPDVTVDVWPSVYWHPGP